MLLSLPAHLRSMILQLVLGGRTVHVDARPRSLRVRLCVATDNDSHAIRTFDNIENQHLPSHYQVRHARCWLKQNDCCELRACLSILLVCRQLYTEAALLPFCLNEFAFDGTNSRSHKKFLNRLTLAQRRSIRRAHFGPQILYLQAPFKPLEDLAGLQEVALFMKHDDICEPTHVDGLSGDRMKWLIDRLRDTKCEALRAICVCISSEEGANESSKLSVIRCAQALGDQMYRSRAGLNQASQRLVLRCRPA
jgi:hypothetical protein